ncbi:hypothetical protein CesoFtcFv8_023667 [Champsocephalus esox]|nr:hypothetical protein CesoFtcFv8_023667 [Champsocephalus esox]
MKPNTARPCRHRSTSDMGTTGGERPEEREGIEDPRTGTRSRRKERPEEGSRGEEPRTGERERRGAEERSRGPGRERGGEPMRGAEDRGEREEGSR